MIERLLALAVGVFLLTFLVDLLPSGDRMTLRHVAKLTIVVCAVILYFWFGSADLLRPR